MPAVFKDLAKKASDLLDRGFGQKNTVKVNTKAANGVKYKGEVKSGSNGKISGKVGASFSHSSGIAVKKLDIANNGTLDLEVRLTGAVDNTEFGLNALLLPLKLPDGDEKCDIVIDHSHDKARVQLLVSPVQPTAVKISGLFQVTDEILAGGEYAGHLGDSWVHDDDNVGLSYTSGKNVVSLASAKKFNNFNLKFFHQHDDDLALAAAVGLNRVDPTKASLSLGGAYTIDKDTSVKAKLSVPTANTKDATASFGFSQRLNSRVKLTAASTVDLDPQNDLFGATFNLGLEFGSV